MGPGYTFDIFTHSGLSAIESQQLVMGEFLSQGASRTLEQTQDIAPSKQRLLAQLLQETRSNVLESDDFFEESANLIVDGAASVEEDRPSSPPIGNDGLIREVMDGPVEAVLASQIPSFKSLLTADTNRVQTNVTKVLRWVYDSEDLSIDKWQKRPTAISEALYALFLESMQCFEVKLQLLLPSTEIPNIEVFNAKASAQALSQQTARVYLMNGTKAVIEKLLLNDPSIK